jgi:hypothetical protein
MRAAMLLLAIAIAIAGSSSSGCGSSTGLPNGGDDGAAAMDLSVPPGADLSTPPHDLSNLSCAPTCQHCQGVCCPGAPNGGCCAPGEWCDNGTCHCGNGAACAPGLFCATGGPVMPPSQCGGVCCGDATHPCPL